MLGVIVVDHLDGGEVNMRRRFSRRRRRSFRGRRRMVGRRRRSFRRFRSPITRNRMSFRA